MYPISSYTLFGLVDSCNPHKHLLDITNQANLLWIAIAPARKISIMNAYLQYLSILLAVNELRISTVVNTDAMGDIFG